MTTDSGRAPSGQALVASDQAASRLAPTGVDPSRRAAEAEAVKREKHKGKSLLHKRWAAVHSPEKGWHVALIDTSFHAEFSARMKARSALLRGDLAEFVRLAGDALLARCASAIEAAAAGETAQTGSTEGESAAREAGDAQ